MAALGWLLGFDQQGKVKDDGLLAVLREAGEKATVDVRALWDRFYLCQMQFDNAATFEVARTLSRKAASDPIALWAYLQVMGGRQTPLGREFSFSQGGGFVTLVQEESPSPLGSAELDHVMACYAKLRARRPDLASSLVLVNVSDELTRAKRLDQEEHFYREAVAGANRLGQIAGAFVLAARRGDAAGLIQLLERYNRVQAGRTRPYYNTSTFYFYSPAGHLSGNVGSRGPQRLCWGARVIGSHHRCDPKKTGAAVAGRRHASPARSLRLSGLFRICPRVLSDLGWES